jgi:DNA polymerase I-like protein with 3'-5' exonuclease and polymerase domains
MSNTQFFVGKYKIDGIDNYATIQEAVDYCESVPEIGLDIETSRHPKLGNLENKIYKGGLDPYLSRVIMIQIGDLSKQFAIDVRDFTREELEPVIKLLHWRDDKLIVGQNLKFEGKHLRHNYGIRLLNVYDTMMAEMSLYNGINRNLSLAGMAETYLGVTKKSSELTLFDNVKETVTLDDDLLNDEDFGDNFVTPFELELSAEMDKSIRLQFVTMKAEPFTKEQVIYGIEDIVYPFLIKQEQDRGHFILGFHFHNPKNIKLESWYTQVGADMEYNGLPFSSEIWSKMHEDNEVKYVERRKALDQYVIENIPKFSGMTLFGPGEEECLIDWKSPKQVIALLRHLDACPKERSKQTKKMEWSASSKALLPTLPNNLKDDYGKDVWHDIVDTDTLKLAYLLFRKTQMNITTYGKEFLKYVHPITGRVHPNYRLHLISSRTATTSPNLLAIPGTHRGAFTLEGTDRVLVVNDYSSQESRNIAAKSKDPKLLDFFNNGHPVFGGDFHSYTSALVHEVRNPESTLKIVPKERPDGSKHPDFTPEMAKMRQDTKAVNFGLVYGITAISLSKQLGIGMGEAEALVSGYFETFPELHAFIEGSKSQASKNGYVLFEPKMKALFLQEGYEEMLEREKECKSYFFTEEYRAMDPVSRQEYKDNLYETKPYIKEWFSLNGIMRSRLENRGCNLKIQGVSAKQSKVSQLNMRKYSVEHPELDWQICLLLHDESVSECPEKYGEEVAELQGKFMEEAASYFCPEVKFETDGGAFKHWKH